MHRLASLPGEDSELDISLVEQPSAPYLFLTSASSDIATLASTIQNEKTCNWEGQIRALPLNALKHPAQIDHYLYTTARETKVILLRLLGNRGHWSYGLEKVKKWQEEFPNRNLIVISGTEEHADELHEMGSIDVRIINRIFNLLKVGGVQNMATTLKIMESLDVNQVLTQKQFEVEEISDPIKWKWEDIEGTKIGVILYRSLYQSGDYDLANSIELELKRKSLVPRIIWVSNLRNSDLQEEVIKIFSQEKVAGLITTTSFSSINPKTNNNSISFWDKLKVPVIQAITSTMSIEEWTKSERGLSAIDLSMQIVMPEIDGRISTRPCAFRALKEANNSLATAVHYLKAYPESVSWICSHIDHWVRLRKTCTIDRKISIMLANYPTKNGRLANGVGLDTPSSACEIIKWLQEEGYYLGEESIPQNSSELITKILSARTNDPQSYDKKPLEYLSLTEYIQYWNQIPLESRTRIINRWGNPSNAEDLEKNGFPILGIKFGNISILIQPSRGYDPESLTDLHCPDLVPPHKYLANYFWIRKCFKAHAVVHLGKHGSLEWLPGKGVGLSPLCYPDILIGELPNIYPFIVNDPGEGSQAKRRSQAVIIDHLTPPLTLAGLHGDLLDLEGLMDEYYESRLISSKRSNIIENKILKLLTQNNWPGIHKESENELNIELVFKNVESYLCEIKESQIRAGLHIFGKQPESKQLIELCLLIAKTPRLDRFGLTQWIANLLNLEIDPWMDEASEQLSESDRKKLDKYITKDKTHRLKLETIEWIEEQATLLLECIVNCKSTSSKLINPLLSALSSEKAYLSKIKLEIWSKLSCSADTEKCNFLKALSGIRIPAGPSGAPTRGRPEVLPTGRNFYSVDLRGLPTESAWDLGKRSAEQILELYLMENGENLKHLALSVWGTSTMRNGGEEICQLLSLLGVKPVWDGPTRRVVSFEIVPLEILQRPRVDVILRISGLFRDAFPNLITYANQAISIVANLDEPHEMNPLAESRSKGENTARIYGSAPNSYGAGLQALIDSGNWESKNDLANAYLAWSKWNYSESTEAISDLDGLKSCLEKVQVVLHSQDNREHDILDSDDYYQFHGGLTAAISVIKGSSPKALFADNANPQKPKIHNLRKEIDKVMRSRVLNPKWINGMKKHGYKGAFEMGASIDYLFAFDATTGMVDDWCYSEICKTWLEEKSTLRFLAEKNPWVLRDIAERLLEASNRNLWEKATKKEIDLLQKIVHKSDKDIEFESFRQIK